MSKSRTREMIPSAFAIFHVAEKRMAAARKSAGRQWEKARAGRPSSASDQRLHPAAARPYLSHRVAQM